MGKMSELLDRCRYATGNICTQLCANSYGEAEAAISALSALPFSTAEMEETAAFLNTTADFLSELCGGEKRSFGDDVREDMISISDSSKELSEKIYDLRDSINTGDLTVDSREIHLRNIEADEGRLLSDEFYDMEKGFNSPKIKTYFGKFSENVAEVLSTDDDWSISEEEARTALPEGYEFENLGKVSVNTISGLPEECYEFVAQDGDRIVKVYVNIHTAAQRQIIVN